VKDGGDAAGIRLKPNRAIDPDPIEIGIKPAGWSGPRRDLDTSKAGFPRNVAIPKGKPTREANRGTSLSSCKTGGFFYANPEEVRPTVELGAFKKSSSSQVGPHKSNLLMKPDRPLIARPKSCRTVDGGSIKVGRSFELRPVEARFACDLRQDKMQVAAKLCAYETGTLLNQCVIEGCPSTKPNRFCAIELTKVSRAAYTDTGKICRIAEMSAVEVGFSPNLSLNETNLSAKVYRSSALVRGKKTGTSRPKPNKIRRTIEPYSAKSHFASDVGVNEAN